MNTIVINKVTLNKLLIVISVSLCMFLSISASKADAAAPVVQTRTETVVTTPSTTHNITIPAVSTGDLSLVMIGHDNNYVTTTPSGWTKLFETANGGWFSIEAFYKFAPTNAGQTTENFVTTSTTNMAAQAFTITGAGVGRVSAGTTAVYGFLTTTPDPPSLNPGWGSQDTLWFAFASQNQGSTMNSWSANYDNNWSSNAGGGSYAHVVRRTLTAASEDPGSFSFSGSWESAANTIAVGPPANTAPTYNTQPYSGYTSTYTRVGPGNTWQAYIWAVDSEQTGANALTWQIRTSSCGAGTLIANGTFTSGVSKYTGNISHNASVLVDGSNTLYMCISDGTLSTTSSPFTLLRDDVSPTASTAISTNPSTVSGNYTVTFTPNDARSTSSNEMSYQIRTASGGGGTLLTSGSANSTSGTPKTTGSITTDTLSQGANTRYVRTCDGANNCTDTSFTVTASTPPSSVTTGAETNKSSYKVTFNGNANPNGSQAYGYFRLYTSAPDCTLNTGGQRFPSLESQDVSIGSGSAGVAFAYTTPTTVLLIASTDYWYCAYSRNVAAGSGVPGTPAAAGYDTFTTPDGPASGCDAPASGDMTISESCTFPQSDYDGVDNGGSGATNTGRITLASGGNITINPGQRIARGSLITNGGSFSIGNGSGSVIRGGVYLKDSDGDGIIDNPVVKVVANTQPAGYVRRNHLYTLPTYNNSSFNYASKMYNAVATSPSSLDCDQTSANAWRFIPSLVTDTDNDGYKTATAAYQQCVGASSSINGRTYYSATASATLWQWLPDAQKLSATTDCQDDPAGVPCVPTSVSATNPSSQTQNNISWSMGGVGAAVPAATGYDIEWCSGSNICTGTQGSGAVLTNVTSTYNHTGRTHTTWYGYGVLAKNAAGSSAYSGKSYAQTAVNCTTAYPDNDQDGYGNSGVITRGILVKTASNSQTSITVTKPADVVNGQLMIAGIGYSGSIASNAITITAPAGWTLIENSNAAISEGMAIYRKVASSEPANYTWSFTATSGGAAHSVDANAWIVTYNNVNTSTPVNVSGKNTGNHGQTSSSANNTASSITTTVANTMVIGAMHSDRGNTTFDDVSGMNTFYNHSPGSSYDATISFDAVQPSAGATGIKSSLHTLGGGWAAVMVALTPLSTSSSCVALPSTGWSANQNDCEDNTTSYYQNTNGYPDIDADGVNPSSTTGMCSGASLRPGVSASSGADCNNTNTNLYQNLTGYIDMDGDLYSPSGSSQICSGAALPTGYVSSVSGTNDCYDGSANAKPGSTYYGITSRGDGSFDYNCDSSQTKQFPDNTLGDDSNGGYTHACPRSSIIAHGNWVEDHCEGSQAICGVAATSVQYVTQANISCGMIAAESSTFSTCWDTNCGSCPGGTMREVKAFAGFNAPNVCYYSFMGNNMYTGVCCR